MDLRIKLQSHEHKVSGLHVGNRELEKNMSRDDGVMRKFERYQFFTTSALPILPRIYGEIGMMLA